MTTEQQCLCNTLTTEEARGLAQRWATAQGRAREVLYGRSDICDAVDTEVLAALLGWVRRRMATAPERFTAWTCPNEDCGFVSWVPKGCDIGGEECTECRTRFPVEPSGTPEPDAGDMARDIADALGLSFVLAFILCELAGWPS